MIKKGINRFRSWDAMALTFLISVVILSVTSDVTASPVINFKRPTPTQLKQSQWDLLQSRRSSVEQFSPYDFVVSVCKTHGLSVHKRKKRSPYPPGFVTWTLKEPCICSPGQLICRCYSTSSASSEGTQKSRRRRSRSKKSKSN